MSVQDRIIIVIPGIMGSTLAYGSQPIWTENIRENYKLLRQNPSLLRWTGRIADARLWKVVYASKVVPFLKLNLWRETLDYLAKSATNKVIECSYDWRQSLQDSCRIVFAHVEAATKQRLREPASTTDVRLVVLTHSMGGLLFRVGYASGLIHRSHLDRVVHMAPPLLGAPVAFRSLVDRTTLPLLNEYVRLMRFMNYSKFMTIMYECFRTFPSMYELLPPKQIAFIRDDRYHRDSPFAQGQFDKTAMSNATITHQLLALGEAQLAASRVPVFTIFSEFNTNKPTDLEYRVRTAGRNSYEILERYSSVYGDGTVLSDSARWSQGSKTLPVSDVDHATMPNSRYAVQLLQSCGV